MVLLEAFLSPVTVLVHSHTGRSLLLNLNQINTHTYQYGISIPLKWYHEWELSCLLPDPSPCKCHYSGISSCCTPWMLLTSLVAAKQGLRVGRRLRNAGCWFFTVSLSSHSPLCPACWYVHHLTIHSPDTVNRT